MYLWRREDPDFAEAWDEALEEGTDLLEDEARRRAMAGSDHLLMFILKSRRPAQYRERSVHEHTGPAGGPVIRSPGGTGGTHRSHHRDRGPVRDNGGLDERRPISNELRQVAKALQPWIQL